MPHARASALWRLGFASHSSLKADRSAPRNGFYGAREPQNETLAVECQLLGIPTPQNIVQFHDLKSLKAMCEAHKAATSGLASVPQRAGRFIVMDFMSSSRSHEAAVCLESAGLDPTTIFNTEQLPNACGYLSVAHGHARFASSAPGPRLHDDGHGQRPNPKPR